MGLSKADQQLVEEVLVKIKKDNRIIGGILFGSSILSESYEDIDITILTTETLSIKQKLSILTVMPDKIDLKFFEDLPLYIAKDAIKGKLLFNRNNERIFEIFVSTFQHWEDFKPQFELYLDVVANGL